LTIVVCLLALGLAGAARADTYLKIQMHTDGRYQNGTVIPAEDVSVENWISARKMASVSPNWKFVADLDQNSFFLINLAEKTYMQVPLPLDLLKVVPAEEAEPITAYKYLGTVAAGEGERTVLGIACKRFDIQRWVMLGGDRYAEQETTAWYAPLPGLDQAVYLQMQRHFHALSNLGPDLTEAYLKIPGFAMAYETVRYNEGTAVKSSYLVTELATREAPAGIYAIPEGFTKKDNYSIRQLQQR
jgi:hypothetical protein